MRTLAISTVVAAALAFATPAFADNAGMAEELFVEGKRLMQERSYEKACEKFKASHDLDKNATGTLLNLALCHELTNRNASAWAEFRQVAAESAGRREDRIAVANEHIAKLLPTLSHVVINVRPEARVVDLRIEIDKSPPIAPASWGVELPIDGGYHTIAVSAPGRVTRTLELTIGDTSDRRTVDVPPLDVAPLAAPTHAPDLASQEAAAAARARRVLGFGLGGLGIATLGVGIVFGVLAAGDRSDASDACPNESCPNGDAHARARDAIRAGNTKANVANILVPVGGVLAAGGLVLILTSSPKGGARGGSLRLEPRANGFLVTRTW